MEQHPITEMECHPLADLFPMMPDADLALLAEDIKANGLFDPIITFEGQILDGRHRFKACRVAGVDPVFQPFEGEDPVAYVVSKNLHRRHLTTAERKKVAAAIVARQPERSNNSIATEVNLSDKTVARVRKEVEANSEIPNKTDRVEASGRKARGRKPNEPKQTPVEEPKSAGEEPRAEEQPKVMVTTGATSSVDPTYGHTSNRPLIEIKVLARNEWQTRALENEPTNAEEAQLRSDAISWETGEIERRWHELKTAEGKALEDAKRFFPNGKGWKAWLKSQKTCEMSSAAMRLSLYHAGYNADGRPENTLTKFGRLTREILQTEDDPRWPQLEAAVKRLIEEYTPAEEQTATSTEPATLPEDVTRDEALAGLILPS